MSKKKLLSIYFIAALILSAFFAITQIICYKNCFDLSVNHFKSGSVLPTVIYILLAISCIFILSSALIFKSNKPRRTPKTSDSDVWANAVMSFFFFAIAAVEVLLYIIRIAKSFALYDSRAGFFEVIFSGITKYLRGERVENLFILLSVVFAVLSGIYFFFCASKKARTKTIIYFSLFPSVFGICDLIAVYFSQNVTHNSPLKITAELSALVFMVYFLSECKDIAGVSESANFNIASLLLALVILSAFSIPRVILTIAGFFSFDADFIYYVLHLATVVYIISKYLPTVFKKRDN